MPKEKPLKHCSPAYNVSLVIHHVSLGMGFTRCYIISGLHVFIPQCGFVSRLFPVEILFSCAASHICLLMFYFDVMSKNTALADQATCS